MIVPSQLAASFTMLDKLVDRFPLPPVAPPIGDTSLTHVMRLAAHSTTSPTPIAMGHSFIMTLYNVSKKCTSASTIFVIFAIFLVTVGDQVMQIFAFDPS
jgi:hypothetical protein